MPLKLDICTRYNIDGGSSRLRYYLYQEELEKAHWQVRFFPFYGKKYLSKLYANKSVKLDRVISLIKRLFLASFFAKNLLIEYELLPAVPAIFEELLLKRRNYILNFDDYVWAKYDNLPYLQDKYDRLIANAKGVIVANDVLYNKVAKLNNNIIKIPTVVKLASYRPKDVPIEKFSKFTIVWIGTPVTYHTYLTQLAPVFQKLTTIFDYELLVIAKESLPTMEGVPQRNINWSCEIETTILSKCHVGIMPLVDDQFARGKSAYKLIQYQAAGIPSIASCVGENSNVIKHNVNGFLANSNDDWIKYLTLLNSNSNLLMEMGENASYCAYEYSLEKYGPIFNQFLLDSLQ
jgi:glycosyltransferase involved in cell wall biosynthesis